MSQESTPTANGRAVLLLIAGIPLTMVLAASWLWYFVVQGDLDLVNTLGTSNRGILVQPPRQLSDVNYEDDTGARFQWVDVEPRWTMLLINKGGICDQACERRLYTTRQIHMALGRELNRVRRVLVSDQPAADVDVVISDRARSELPTHTTANLRDFVGSIHAGLMLLSVEPDVLNEIASEWGEDHAQWYLVDPSGWIMMRFGDDLPYKDVIRDMKFLLKNSGG